MTNEKRWLLYDWANSVFATSVVAAFFPIVLRSYWAKGLDSQTVTFQLGLTNSLISFLLFLILPLIGYAIDRKIKSHQRVLFFTAVCGGAMVAFLFLVGEGSSTLALSLYGASFIFFALGNTQCDAMLVRLQKENPKRNLGNLSSLGFLYGYLGGGILLTLQSLSLIFYKQLGFDSALLPAKLCFLTSGLWWILFSLPLLKIKFKEVAQVKLKSTVLADYKGFLMGLDKRGVLYLISFFLYIDVVFTTYKMAVDFGLSMGLSQNHLIAILIYVQLIGVPGTLLMNKIADLFSVKIALNVGLAMFALVIACSPLVKSLSAFAALATFIGISQGGIQALSRSHFANIIPDDQQGVGFSFLNVFGKLSAILGPLIVGVSAYLMGENTYSFFTLLPLLLLGMWTLHLSFKGSQVD